MRTLLVQNFGSIINEMGLVINITPVTVIIGEQSTGKSTIAKLISEFSWLEKALDREDFPKSEVEKYNRFRKNYCSYHGLQNFFQKDTLIVFHGDRYSFEYKNGRFKVYESRSGSYLRPQVMYSPAERNLVSAIEHAEKIRKLPGALATLLDEYNRALRASKEGLISLPLPEFSLQYDKLNKITWLNGKGAKIRVHEAASGLQSLIPLSVVSRHLGALVTDNGTNSTESYTNDSFEERQRMERMIQSILKDRSLDESVRSALLRELSAGSKNACFINVVEEPEQNLFPISQKYVLFDLLRIRNTIPQNELIITTHSPYIINYLSLAIKASDIQSRYSLGNNDILNGIVPTVSRIDGNLVSVYMTTSDGKIDVVEKYDGMPSDQNVLNDLLDDCNLQYERLLDLEEQYEA